MLAGSQCFKRFNASLTEALVPRPPTRPNPFGTYLALTVERSGLLFASIPNDGFSSLSLPNNEVGLPTIVAWPRQNGHKPNMTRIRSEGGHAWTLKGKCQFCGMTRVDFKLSNRPDCEWHGVKATKPKAPPRGNE